MLYFTTLPRSPWCTYFYKIWFGGISPGLNHIFTIPYQPVTGFWFCEGSKFAISHRKAWSPLSRCLHYRAARAIWLLLDPRPNGVLEETKWFFGSFLMCHWTVNFNSDKTSKAFIARQHTDARYWYSKSVCPSVRLSVRFRYQMKTA